MWYATSMVSTTKKEKEKTEHLGPV